MLSTPMSTSVPNNLRALDRPAGDRQNLSRQTLLNVATKRPIDNQLSALWPTSRTIGVPLRNSSPILHGTTASGRIAAKFS